jgi:hypothetical protein
MSCASLTVSADSTESGCICARKHPQWPCADEHSQDWAAASRRKRLRRRRPTGGELSPSSLVFSWTRREGEEGRGRPPELGGTPAGEPHGGRTVFQIPSSPGTY